MSHSLLGDSLFPIFTYTEVADAGRRERSWAEDIRSGDDKKRYRNPIFWEKFWVALHNLSFGADTVRPVTTALLSHPLRVQLALGSFRRFRSLRARRS